MVVSLPPLQGCQEALTQHQAELHEILEAPQPKDVPTLTHADQQQQEEEERGLCCRTI